MTVEEILSDPTIEAVAVETEEIYLTKYALQVARAGKHLHMEKPGGVGYGAFCELVETLREKKLAFTLGYMYRFNPKIEEALRKVKRGDLGEIYAVEAHMDCLHPAEVRQWLSAFPGGMLYFLGCHLIDLIYRIMGEPSEIIPLSCSTGFDGVTGKDYGMVVYKYPRGISFAKTTAAEPGGFMRRQLVICGEKGTIEIKPLEVSVPGGQYTVLSESHSSAWHTPWETSQSEIYDRYDAMMQNFAEIVRGKENPYSYDYELSLFRTLLACCGAMVEEAR
jgi:predicted dehydrogenase